MDGDAMDLVSVPLARTRVWKGNPRKTVRGIDELAASIKDKGVRVPVLARPVVGDPEVDYEIVAGQRRFLAAGVAGLDAIPAIVRAVDDDEALELGLLENAARADVDPLEEAEAIERLVAEHGRSVPQVAARLGRSVRWVERRRALLNLTPATRAWAVSLSLPLAHMESLAAVTPDVQARALAKMAHLTAQNVPPHPRFLEYITWELHRLSDAPFDPSDADLGARACNGCQRRSDAQGNLFGDTRGACCLDAACWGQKSEALWERAQKDAKKRRLKVIPAKDVIAYEYAGSGFNLRHDAPYLARPSGAGDKPVAITRRETGHVVELYAKPAPVAEPDDDTDEGVDPEDEEGDTPAGRRREQSDRERRQSEREAAAVARLRKLYDLAAEPALVTKIVRMALLSDLYEHSIIDAARLASALGLDASKESTAVEIVAAIPDDALLRVLLTLLATGRFDVEADDLQPYEREILARLEAPAVPTVRLWIREAAWDALTAEDRDDLEEPIGGAAVAWDGRVGWVTAAVPEGEVLTALRGIAEARRVVLHEGEAEPVEAPAAPDALVEVLLSDWPSTRGLDVLGDGRVVLWMPRDDADEGLCATVPASLVEQLRANAGDCWAGTRPATLTSSVIAVGAPVATIDGPREVVAVVCACAPGAPGAADGVVLKTPKGPRVAWIDTAGRDKAGAVYLVPSAHHTVAKGPGGGWVATKIDDEAPVSASPAEEDDDGDEGASTQVGVELRVKRGDWLQHRSGLQDSAKGLLHKRWEPDGEDRVVRVAPGSEAQRKVLDYANAQGIGLRVDGRELAKPEAPAPKKASKKGGAK